MTNVMKNNKSVQHESEIYSSQHAKEHQGFVDFWVSEEWMD